VTTPYEKEEVARNEDLFRQVNERIVEVAAVSHPEDDLIVLCECGQTDCLVQLDVPAPTYAEVREHGTWFIVQTEHNDPAVEQVVRREGGFLIVEKLGVAGELAEELDPSS
jgi:hypothetical protein